MSRPIDSVFSTRGLVVFAFGLLVGWILLGWLLG
jgi:hypothetical protein